MIPKGSRQEVVHATINSSPLWSFCEVLTLTKNLRILHGASESDIEERKRFSDWVLSIGDGAVGESNDVDVSVNIPPDLHITSSGDPLASIVNSTYLNILEDKSNIHYFQNIAILAPKNSIVDRINEYVLDLVLGDEKIYLSYDTPLSSNMGTDAVDDVHTLEFLNTIIALGLPNHKLRLKVGVSVMLLSNFERRSKYMNN